MFTPGISVCIFMHFLESQFPFVHFHAPNDAWLQMSYTVHAFKWVEENSQMSMQRESKLFMALFNFSVKTESGMLIFKLISKKIYDYMSKQK